MKWALFFGVVLLACAGLFIIAPFCGWWLPEGVSSHAKDVDFLFYLILGFTAFFFILTETLLVLFMARFGDTEKRTPVEIPGILKPLANVLDSQHKIEMAWTVVPAAILLIIAFSQISTWANIKYESRQKDVMRGAVPYISAVSARQFEWRIRYPSTARVKEWLTKKDDAEVVKDRDSFGKIAQKDDVYVVNELHVVKDEPVLVHLSTRDVLHSFNLPHFRVKQDAVPGKLIPVWFRPTKANMDADGKQIPSLRWDLACAELCGWGHGRMIGRIHVHESSESFLRWLDQTEKKQNAVPTASAPAP